MTLWDALWVLAIFLVCFVVAGATMMWLEALYERRYKRKHGQK